MKDPFPVEKLAYLLLGAVLLLAGTVQADTEGLTACSEITLSQSAQRDYRLLEHALRERASLTRTDQVAKQVIEDWKALGRRAPSESVELALYSEALPARGFERVEGEPLEGFGDARPYSVNGSTFYFRHRYSKFSWVAFALNQVMQLDQAPRTRLATLGGHSGVLSDEVPGECLADTAANENIQAYLNQAVHERRIQPASLSEAEGFHFLIGDNDGWVGNFKVSAEGAIAGYDFDSAFEMAFAWHYGNPDSLGAALPRLYTPRFIHGLSRLTDAEIWRRTRPFPEAARRQISFRRDMMLKDLAERGEAAVLRDWEFPLETRRE